MTFEEKLQKYAKMCITVGVNLKKDQSVFITTDINSAEFARMIAKEAYLNGAKDVHLNYVDEKFAKVRFDNAPDAAFEEAHDFLFFAPRNGALEKDFAFISIVSDDPEILKDCDPKKIAINGKTRSTLMQPFQKKLMNNQSQWLVIAGVSDKSASKVFPNDTLEVAKEKLWNAYFDICRVDENDITENWNKHVNYLKEKVEWLNNENFEKLIIKSSNGTDLTVGLVENHIWAGGGDTTQKGHYFMPNLPTEEVFCMPHKNKVDGVVKSTKPLIFRGNLIDEFSITFKDGKAIDFDAKVGYETLKGLLDTDEGAKRLGEIALVPFESPISKSNLVFYNTLYDENASCHLAFGRAYGTNILNGETMPDEEYDKHGVNNSLVHEDFMFGAKDTDIIGVKHDGTEVQIFKNGNYIN